MRLTRRQLLAWGPAFGAIAVVGAQVPAASATSLRTQRAAGFYDRDTWTPLISRTVALHTTGGSQRVTVAGVRPVGPPAGPDGGDAFIIVFSGVNASRNDGTHTVSHPELGRGPLYLSAPDGHGVATALVNRVRV